MIDCYYDAQGCLVCPELTAIAYVPPRIEKRMVLGWNAGADSIDQLDGDLHAVFSMPRVVGVVLGLKGHRQRSTVPALIEHGWSFVSSGGLDIVQVMEGGTNRTPPIVRALDDSFEIRRQAGVVRYLRNDQLVYTSTRESLGPKVINACVYASGDGVR